MPLRSEREVLLKSKEAEVKEKALEAEVKKQVEKNSAQQSRCRAVYASEGRSKAVRNSAGSGSTARKADADRYSRERKHRVFSWLCEAEVKLIRAKVLPRQRQWIKSRHTRNTGAAVAEMLIKVLPDVARLQSRYRLIDHRYGSE